MKTLVSHVAAASKSSDPDKIMRSEHVHTYFKNAWYALACFIALVSLGHFISIACVWLRARSKQPTRKRRSVIRQLPLAIIDTLRVWAFRWTIPLGTGKRWATVNLAEVLLTMGYAALLFTWSLINSTSTKGVKYDPKYWANVAGNVLTTQLPLVAALGMKNNIISYLTGISFDKLNFLHRMSARIICVLIWLHAAGRIELGLEGKVALSEPYVRCGLMAAIALTILVVVSVRPIREVNYEFFLVAHFLMVLILLLGAYFHADAFDFGYLIIPSFVLWGLDRLLRVACLVCYNYGYFRPGGAASKKFDAHIEVLCPQFIRLTLRRPNFLRWRPGQSAYLTIPGVTVLPFEAHPFTISTIDVPRGGIPALEGDAVESKEAGALQHDNNDFRKHLVFLLRVRAGFTQRLLNAASVDRSLKIFLDGPYSSPPLLSGSDNVVLIAGGSGVSFTLPLLLDILHRARSGELFTKRVAFVWAIREAEHTKWISDTLYDALQNIPNSINVSIQIFVTAAAQLDNANGWEDDSMDDEKATNNACDAELLTLPVVQLQQGRPDIVQLLDAEMKNTSESMSVNVCGTRALTGTVTKALRRPRFFEILKGGPTVALHVEGFGSS